MWGKEKGIPTSIIILVLIINLALVTAIIRDLTLKKNSLETAHATLELSGESVFEEQEPTTTITPVSTHMAKATQKVKVGELDLKEHCSYELPENPEYKASIVTTDFTLSLSPGDSGTKTVYVKNEGNTRWFSHHSGCEDHPTLFLGTQKDQDAPSKVGTIAPELNRLTWLNTYYNRVRMTQQYVDPGEIATFHINLKAPNHDTIYRQYFSPVIEGVKWLDEGLFAIDIISGQPSDETLDKAQYVAKTRDIALLPDDKSLEVNLTEQKVYLRYGEEAVNSFTISSGARSTPTPTGHYQIHREQDVRVAGAWPHYVMPNYLSLVPNGAFGFHALPSLRNDNGVFWTEALNHIGTPVSHGCVRLLPDDSDRLKSFTEVGTPVWIHR